MDHKPQTTNVFVMDARKLQYSHSPYYLSLCSCHAAPPVSVKNVLLWPKWDLATSVWMSALCKQILYATCAAILRIHAWDFEMNVFLWECISHPQSPKPISQFSDEHGSFSSFTIGSKANKYSGIAPVGGWELEF